MSFLSQVKSGKEKEPYFIVIYGVEGIGKTTFAADAPKPLFIDVEHGTSELDVHRLNPKSFKEIVSILDEIIAAEALAYQTLVLDSLDSIEPLIWDEVCREGNKSNIKRFAYGEGYTIALQKWKILLDKLRVIQLKGLHIIMIAHHKRKEFKDPQQIHDYDRYELQLHDGASLLIRQRVKAILFADEEIYVKKDEDQAKGKALGDGVRILKTERRPAHDGKNRYGLPYILPLSWEAFDAAAQKGNPDSPEAIRNRMEGMLSILADNELTAKVRAEIEKAGENGQRLALLENRLKTRIGENEE